MSSAVVRRTIKGWLSDPSMSVPFYNTINEEQDPTDDYWCTVLFNNPYREVTTFCEGKWTEEGEAEVVYFGPPGINDDALATMLEAEIIKLMARRDPTGKLILVRSSPPYEYSSGSAAQKYALSVYVDYTLYS